MTSRIQRFDFSVNLLQALLWQYNDAERLQALLRQKSEWYGRENSDFWSDWIEDVFNLRTANNFGLSVWAIILEAPQSFGIPGSGPRGVFGFGVHNLNFNRGNFGRDASGIARLTTEQRRMVLQLRYYQLVSDGTVPHINSVLDDVFGMGYVLDGQDMTLTYVFPTAISSTVRTILTQFDLLPRPAGVKTNILIDPSNVFGFEPFYENFENGGFGA